ncbi:MAG: hypothetical protein LH615_14635, partial [Ferruginibacter sp.]|nr:hypothetical protein [Ferruginibacter sp.]
MNVFKQNNKDKVLFELLPQAFAGIKKTIFDPLLGESNDDIDEKPPLRSEIFTKERLEAHAITIAKRQEIFFDKNAEHLLKRLAV